MLHYCCTEAKSMPLSRRVTVPYRKYSTGSNSKGAEKGPRRGREGAEKIDLRGSNEDEGGTRLSA
jgi:hypothetical protein